MQIGEEIINIIFYLLIPLVIVACLYYYNSLLQGMPDKQRQALQEIAKLAVYSVEQQYSSVESEHKKNAAMNIASSIFRAFKLTVPESYVISAAIEACVLEMNMFQLGGGNDDDLLPIINPRSPLKFPPAPQPTQLPTPPATPQPAGPGGGDDHAS